MATPVMECPICYKYYKEEDDFLHWQSHYSQKELKCKLCTLKFENQRDLICHRFKHAVYVCGLCKQSYKGTRRTFLRHFELFHNDQAQTISNDFEDKASRSRAGQLDKFTLSLNFETRKRTLLRKKQLKNHPKVHKSTKDRFSCNYCSISYKYKKSLETHIVKKHMECEYSCSQCTFKSWSLKDFKSHTHGSKELSPQKQNKVNTITSKMPKMQQANEKSVEGKYLCDFCGKTFSEKRKLSCHRFHSHKKSNYLNCNFCDFSTKYKRSLRGHIAKCHLDCKSTRYLSQTTISKKDEGHDSNALSYPCKLCDEVFVTKFSLNLHNVEKHLQGFKCEICGQVRCYKKDLLRHFIEKHHVSIDKPKFYPCSICDKKFTSNTVYRIHLKEHENDKKPYVCHYCPYESTIFRYFREHVRRHKVRQSEKFKCDVCGSLFSRKCHLVQHFTKNHSATLKKKFKCILCGQKFSHIFPYRKHLKEHSAQKPYICKYCPYVAQMFSYFLDHVRRHKIRESVKCNMCKSVFSRKYDLLRHFTQKHNMEIDKTTHKCVICESEFLNYFEFRKHVREHRDKKPYACNYCSCVSQKFRSFREHVKRHRELQKN